MRALYVLALSLMLSTTAQAGDRPTASTELMEGMVKFRAGDVRTANVHVLNAVKTDPDFPLAQAVYGRLMLELGNGEYASKAFDRAAKLGMAENQLSHLRGHAAYLRGDLKAANNLLQPFRVDKKYHGYAARILAKTLAASGDFGSAGRAFEDAINLTPNNATLWADVGRFRYGAGNIAGAIEAGQRAVAVDARNVEALTLMGELVRTQYGLTASVPWFERALKVDGQNLTVLGELAATYGESGRNKDMLDMTRRMLQVDEGNPRAYYLQAVLAARANMFGLAKSLLDRAGGRMNGYSGVTLLTGVITLQNGAGEQAARILRPLLEEQPANDKVRRLLGSAYFKAGNMDAVIDTLGAIARRSDADSYSLSLVGRALEAKGDRYAAAQLLDRVGQPGRPDASPFELPALGGDPNNANVAIPEIARLIANGRAGDALTRARFVQSRNPGVPAAHILIGDSLNAMRRYGEAAEAYRHAANIQFNENVALRLVRTLVRAGKNNDALNVLDLFITQNPRNLPARQLAGEVFITNAMWPQAIAVLEGVRVQVGNRDAMLLNNLSWAYLNTGDTEKALSFAQAAYKLSPTNPVVTNSWGWTLFKAGRDKDKAVAMLEKASAMAPENPGFRYQLALAAVDVGEKAKAKRALQKALAIPDFADRAAAQNLLKKL